jgi:hypothetical protein
MGNAAIHTGIQTWHPPTCKCIVDVTVDYDDILTPGEPLIHDGLRHHKFLFMRKVCEKHTPLKSLAFKPNHDALSANVMKILQETKDRNVRKSQEKIDVVESPIDKEDLLRNHQLIHIINQRNHLIFTYHTSVPHAHDEHIYDQIKAEYDYAHDVLGQFQTPPGQTGSRGGETVNGPLQTK